MTVLGIQKIFHQVISREDERASSWIPSVRDMVKILVNYGEQEFSTVYILCEEIKQL